MAELVMSFDAPVVDEAGAYRAKAVGRRASDARWEGWLEFVPVGGGDAIVTPIESTQPAREHLVYWAEGLTAIYLEGALARAKKGPRVHVRVVEPPVHDGPAERPRSSVVRSTIPDAVLDPFHVGERSLDVLRQELTALNRPRLLNIIAAYGLNPAGVDVSGLSELQLVHFVVVAVETQLKTQRAVRAD